MRVTMPEDDTILALYRARDEQAIAASDRKYGAYCAAVAHNILHDRQDEEECVNDTWLTARNRIPPTCRPACVSTSVG